MHRPPRIPSGRPPTIAIIAFLLALAMSACTGEDVSVETPTPTATATATPGVVASEVPTAVEATAIPEPTATATPEPTDTEAGDPGVVTPERITLALGEGQVIGGTIAEGEVTEITVEAGAGRVELTLIYSGPDAPATVSGVVDGDDQPFATGDVAADVVLEQPADVVFAISGANAEPTSWEASVQVNPAYPVPGGGTEASLLLDDETVDAEVCVRPDGTLVATFGPTGLLTITDPAADSPPMTLDAPGADGQSNTSTVSSQEDRRAFVGRFDPTSGVERVELSVPILDEPHPACA